MRLKVKDVMATELITVAPDLPFKEVADVLIRKDIGGVPVVDAKGSVLGVVTESDLIAKPAYHHEEHGARRVLHSLLEAVRPGKAADRTPGRTAQEIMSSPAITVSMWDDVEDVGRVMLRHGVGRLPVLRDGVLVGIITRRDLVRQFHKTDEEITGEVERALRDPLLSESEPNVAVHVDEGVVALTGTVRYERDIEVVGALVAGVGGVVEVHNDLAAADSRDGPPAPDVAREPPSPDAPPTDRRPLF